ncbi:hypothetical protein [Streptomyces sp. NPDC013489]|uniref:hypothetical protein n=1 Tax=Streptomyces sp. NPDC013489 TaxID=3155606 RepID=UPI00340C9D55
MTDISPESAPGGPGDERIPDDLSSLFADLEPEKRDRLEKSARAAVRGSKAGMADATTGSEHEIPMPAEAVGGLIFEDDDEDQEPGAAAAVPAARPASDGWTWKNAFPEGTFDSGVWAHRKRVFLRSLARHAGHSHVYAWRLSKLSGLGMVAGARDTWHYYTAQEYADMIDEARRKKMKSDIIAALREERTEFARARRREPLLVGTTTAVLTVIAAATAIADVYGLLAASPAALLTFGILSALGLREHKRRNPEEVLHVFTAPASDRSEPLTDETINKALRTAVPGFRDEDEIKLRGRIRQVAINADEAKFDLPDHLTIEDLEAKLAGIAGALRVDRTWLDIREDGHPGRIAMWMAHADPFADGKVSPLFELLDADMASDVWDIGIPVGYNRRGEVRYLKLRHVMALLGGMSRTGKGMVLRNLICGLAMDPRVNIRLATGRKAGEHQSYARACATFFGRRPERLILLLDAIEQEAQRREEWTEEKGIPKLTKEHLDKFPLEIVIIDEFQQYDDDGIKKRVVDLAGYVAALNIVLLISTQDPDANTVPPKYKKNAGAKMATRTASAAQTNAILNDGATGAGLAAHDKKLPKHPGITILDFEGAEGELVRSFFIEDSEYDGAAPLIDAGVEIRKRLKRAPGQFDDLIEEFLYEQTSETSVAGGPKGTGRPGPRPTGTAVLEKTTVLTLMLDAFAKAAAKDSKLDRLRTTDLLQFLGTVDPDTWGWEAIGVDEPTEDTSPEDAKAAFAAYGRKGGKKLAEEIAQVLEGTDRELAAKSWTKGGEAARGYFLAEVREAAGIAPE